jgi:DNA invertase Pin-like site-specific DNA recombinase
LTVVDEYAEPGRSARDTKNRPKFSAMMKRLREARDADCIIVYNRSRLHRDAIDASLTKRDSPNSGSSADLGDGLHRGRPDR